MRCRAVTILATLVLNFALTSEFVVAQQCGDVNLSGTVSATDALAVLGRAVDLDVRMSCGAHDPCVDALESAPTPSFTVEDALDLTMSGTGMVLSPDAGTAYVSLSDPARVLVVNLATFTIADEIALVGTASVVSDISDDGTKLLLTSDTDLAVLDIASRTSTPIGSFWYGIWSNASLVGDKAYVATINRRTVGIAYLDGRPSSELNLFDPGSKVSTPSSLVKTSDRRRILIAERYSSVVHVLNAVSDQVTARLSAAFSVPYGLDAFGIDPFGRSSRGATLLALNETRFLSVGERIIARADIVRATQPAETIAAPTLTAVAAVAVNGLGTVLAFVRERVEGCVYDEGEEEDVPWTVPEVGFAAVADGRDLGRLPLATGPADRSLIRIAYEIPRSAVLVLARGHLFRIGPAPRPQS